jgi:dipeptidyl aminopeptidase/acylaminoacyl peptidase
MSEERLQLADYYRLQLVDEPAVSPDGRLVAYVVTSFRRAQDERLQNLWLVPSDGSSAARRLTRGATADRHPRFSPDGRLLAFLSQRPDDPEGGDAAPEGRRTPSDKPDRPKKPKAQIWAFDLAAPGEPRQLTRQPEGVESFDWSPDARRIVFAARSPNERQAAYLKAIRHEGGPLVIDRVQFKHDLHGYLDDVRTHLFLLDVESGQVEPLTDGPCDETDPVWSPDGRTIAFLSNRTGDADNNRRTDVWLIDVEDRRVRRLTFGDVAAEGLAFSPDGQWVAFLSSLEPENSYALTHLMVVPTSAAEPVADLAGTVGVGWSTIGGIVPDDPSGDPLANARVYPQPLRRTPVRVLTADLDRPVVSPPRWLDDKTLLALAGDRGQTRLLTVHLDRGPAFAFPTDRDSTLEALAVGGDTVVLGWNHPETGRELYRWSPGAAPVRLTNAFRWLREERAVVRCERVAFTSEDGTPVEGLVLTPPGFVPGRDRAPLLVVIHGGPMAYDSPGFRFDRHYWAHQGYLVLMVNYRGSTSYGEAFCRVIQGDWGPREHADVMSGVDHLVAAGWADPDRLFVSGFSQGGIMTNWAVGHTDRFRAAVSEHGMWDYVAAYGTDDCHLWWQDDLGVPWQNEAAYRRVSPMSGVARIRTPLLLMAGQEDWRCPLSQSEELYLTLKKRGVPTRLVIYQGERHAVTKPRRAIDRLIRIGRWLAQWGGLPFADDSAEGYPDP